MSSGRRCVSTQITPQPTTISEPFPGFGMYEEATKNQEALDIDPLFRNFLWNRLAHYELKNYEKARKLLLKPYIYLRTPGLYT